MIERGRGRAVSRSVVRGATAVLIALLLMVAGGEPAAAASGCEVERTALALELTAADECDADTGSLSARAAREARRPGRASLPRSPAPATAPTGPATAQAPKDPWAPAAGARGTVLRC
ncbi:hypothetical protein [Streptomyces sp. ISL-11]|uniref:hypothetical protein n=1 Tax=Streptomyces sp. ISL-11 TaxID=2819174 RepID=UPI001BE61EA0|nr:hypothetical protein [Streptomyces sp. ISL-11]MBT2386575.1 hypothetical protein [Streptomyces sp. ISL-11]